MLINTLAMPFTKETNTAINPLLILSLIGKKETYAYDIIKEVKVLSDDQVNLKEGTLYPLLKKMKARGLVRSRWKTAPSGSRRKYYTLSQSGISALMRLKAEWIAANAIIEKLAIKQL